MATGRISGMFRTARGRQTIGALLTAVGLLLLVITWIAAPPRAPSGWPVAQARVSAVLAAPKDRSCRADAVKVPVFDYPTPAGTLSTPGATWCDMGAHAGYWKVGDTGQVAFDPSDPHNAVVVGRGAPPYPWGFLLFAVVFAGLGVLVWWSARRLPPAATTA